MLSLYYILYNSTNSFDNRLTIIVSLCLTNNAEPRLTGGKGGGD